MPTLTNIMHELGDGTRLRVFQTLLGGRRNVTEIVHALGLTQPQVSYHLKKLRESGLATEEREGRWVYYQANWATGDAHIRELLELMARWSGSARSGSAGSGSALSGSAGSGSAHRRGTGARAGSAPAAPKHPPASGKKDAADDEGRPVIERPKRPGSDIDDFLL